MTDFLQLQSLRTLVVREDPDRYVVRAEGLGISTKCANCGDMRLHGHGSQDQEYMDTPSHGLPVVIQVARRRVRCVKCGRTQFDPIPDLNGKRLATERFVRYVESRCLKDTFSSIARDVCVDEKTVRNIFDDYVAHMKETLRFETPRCLGIDELKIIGAYRAVLTNIEKKTLFEMLPTRNKKEVVDYLRKLPKADTVEFVVMDMWNPYRQAAKECLPQARVVVDRFHIQRMGNEALEKVRKQIRKSLPTRQRLKLKDDRKVLLMRQHDLSEKSAALLLSWARDFPLLGEAHALKEGFMSIWDQPTKAQAEATFEQWRKNITPETATHFEPAVRAMENWWEPIFNYFDKPITNAYTESVNGLTRVVNRMGRGYSFEVIRARMLYDKKATRDGSVTKLVPDDDGSSVMRYMTSQNIAPARKMRSVVVCYGAYIPTLVRLAEEGHFD